MSIRNCGDIGVNTQYIVKRLIANQNLLKLLYYTDKDPLAGDDLTQDQIQDEVFEKLFKGETIINGVDGYSRGKALLKSILYQ